MASRKITLKGLKEKSNKSLYAHLLKHKWDKGTIIALLADAGIVNETLANLEIRSLKQLVEKYHNDICECVLKHTKMLFRGAIMRYLITTKKNKIIDLEDKSVSSYEYVDKKTAEKEWGEEEAFYNVYYYDSDKGEHIERDGKGGSSMDCFRESEIVFAM